MHAFVAAGAGFLLAVLWFDLMFDVQVRGHRGALPSEVLTSISGYYRRVTVEAWPMNRLIAVVMLLTLAGIIGEIIRGRHRWIALLSLLAAASAVGLARIRTIPNAARIGRVRGSLEEQSALARVVYADHLYCLGAIALLLVLQLAFR